MTDAEIRGKLLKHFYDLRHNGDGWVPTSEIILSPVPVSRQAIGNVCQQMAGVGWIEWEPFREEHAIGRAHITGLGVDVVNGDRAPSIELRFPNVEQGDATEPYTPEAAKAVYEAIQSLVASGQRAYSLNVPFEAESILVRKGKGATDRADASRQIKAAIIGLAQEGKIDVFPEPRRDWLIKEPINSDDDDMATKSTDVFIVHGHDDGARETIARFIEKIGFNAVILHERPNKGRTIITKFQEEAENVGFAIVLMTPDDHGGKAGAVTRPRARQNVVFELGFFIGALGPAKVAAIVKGDDLERPSDFDGVVYISMNGHWKNDLGKELEAAGYPIDWKKVGTA